MHRRLQIAMTGWVLAKEPIARCRPYGSLHLSIRDGCPLLAGKLVGEGVLRFVHVRGGVHIVLVVAPVAGTSSLSRTDMMAWDSMALVPQRKEARQGELVGLAAQRVPGPWLLAAALWVLGPRRSVSSVCVAMVLEEPLTIVITSHHRAPHLVDAVLVDIRRSWPLVVGTVHGRDEVSHRNLGSRSRQGC